MKSRGIANKFTEGWENFVGRRVDEGEERGVRFDSIEQTFTTRSNKMATFKPEDVTIILDGKAVTGFMSIKTDTPKPQVPVRKHKMDTKPTRLLDEASVNIFTDVLIRMV